MRRVASGRVGAAAGVLAAVALLAVLASAGWVVTETGMSPGGVEADGEADAVVALAGDPGRLAPAKVLREVVALGPAMTIHRAC